MPRDVILDILAKLRLRADCARISVSNAKPNIALSVRILQHPQDTFADLMTTFPRDFDGPEDFPQTLIYAGGRIEVEKMQDFLRRNTPEHIDPHIFEFYHRFIAEKRKESVQERVENGILRGVSTTDALGMVSLNFRPNLKLKLCAGYGLSAHHAGPSLAGTAIISIPCTKDWPLCTIGGTAWGSNPLHH
jgi:hypothetical protein